MALLGYDRWENFHKAIERAIDSCKASEIEPADHFRSVTKMVQIGSGAERAVKDHMLTRHACYLIAQNGDPRKEEIAFAQSYFAVQTRKQELIEERAMGIIKHEKSIVDFFTGAGTGIVVSCLFSPDSPIRTTVIIVGIIMIGIGWYKKSKNDKKIFQYMKEQNNFEKKH